MDDHVRTCLYTRWFNWTLFTRGAISSAWGLGMNHAKKKKGLVMRGDLVKLFFSPYPLKTPLILFHPNMLTWVAFLIWEKMRWVVWGYLGLSHPKAAW